MSRTSLIILFSVLGVGILAWVIMYQAKKHRQRIQATNDIATEPEMPVYTLPQDTSMTQGQTEITPASTPEQEQYINSGYGFTPGALANNYSLYN